MIETSGPKFCESLLKLSRGSSSSKTCRACSASERDLAYAAGLIDGEGSIGIYRRFTDARWYYYPRLTVEMSYKGYSTLKRMEESFGGSIGTRAGRSSKVAQQFCWRLGAGDVACFLVHLIPFLRIKVRQARLAVECWQETDPKVKEAMKTTMHGLNATGPPKFPPGAFAILVGDRWVAPQMTLQGILEPFSGPWPASGSLRNGVCSERTTSAPRIGGRESSSWPTARAEDSESCGNHPGARDSLTGATRSWPTARVARGPYCRDHGDPDKPVPTLEGSAEQWQTPKSPDGGNRSRGHDRKDELLLNGQAEQWATPTQRDWKSGDLPNRVGSPALSRQAPKTAMPGPASSPSDPTSLPPCPTKGTRRRLNPRFVEFLMGLPIGWTDLRPLAWTSYEHWVTQSSRLLRRLLS